VLAMLGLPMRLEPLDETAETPANPAVKSRFMLREPQAEPPQNFPSLKLVSISPVLSEMTRLDNLLDCPAMKTRSSRTIG